MVWNGRLQPAGVEFLGHGKWRYHVYIFPDAMAFHDSIIYDCNWSLKIAAPEARNRTKETELAALNEKAVLNGHIVK